MRRSSISSDLFYTAFNKMLLNNISNSLVKTVLNCAVNLPYMKTWISRLVIVVLVCFTNLMPTSAQNTLTTLGLTSSNYAAVAYSVRQLSTGYTGPLMRIRRSSDGNTYDVWPDANGQFSSTSYISAANPVAIPGSVNGTTALSTITSGATFTVAIWYDQSTNSSPKNLTQTTAANQPTIISSGTIQTENSKPFIRFYGTTGTVSVPSSVYNSLNLASTLSTNGQISVVNKFASGGDGFILSHSSTYYNWHSDPGNSKLFDGTYAASSLLNSTIKQNGTTVDRANAVFNTSLGINTIQPQTANSGTAWDNIGTDRVYHRVTGGGGYAELVVFSAALSAANTSLVEGSQKRFFGIAVPTITSLSSYSGDIGSSVTITGTGFDATAANNVVYFGSTKVTPSSASTTSLTVTVPAGAIYAPVSVVNTIANLQAFSQRPFNVTFNGGNSAIAFKPSLNFASSSANIGSSVGADFDGDGKMDLASVINGSNIVNVFRNTNSVAGTPSFGTALALTPGSTCKEGIAVADFNGDGLMDLVVANNGNGMVAVFKNTSTSGTISFASAVTFTVGSTPRNIAVGDFDNDGKMDIACPSSNASNNYLSI